MFAQRVKICLLVLAVIGLGVGCVPAAIPVETAVPTQPDPTATATVTIEPPTPVATPDTTPQALPSPTTERIAVCSPLAGFELQDLAGTISNPYAPPRAGSDDPHQGLDLADRQGVPSIAVSGMPVHIVLAGRVVAVIRDRFPYGNAVLVETSAEQLPENVVLPQPLAEPWPAGPLSCPELSLAPGWNQEPRSLYLLYAHMLKPPELNPGDSVTCGQQIGQVGMSGNALNPHLHLEARGGPSGYLIEGMAHYLDSASEAEMAGYCAWRTSGVFLHFNPACLWGECN